MIFVSPLTTFALGHRAFHFAVADSGHIAAFSQEGIGSLLAPDHQNVTSFDVESRPKGVAISPSGDRLVLLKDGALSLLRLPDFTEIKRIEQVFEGCHFSPTGSL